MTSPAATRVHVAAGSNGWPVPSPADETRRNAERPLPERSDPAVAEQASAVHSQRPDRRLDVDGWDDAEDIGRAADCRDDGGWCRHADDGSTGTPSAAPSGPPSASATTTRRNVWSVPATIAATWSLPSERSADQNPTIGTSGTFEVAIAVAVAADADGVSADAAGEVVARVASVGEAPARRPPGGPEAAEAEAPAAGVATNEATADRRAADDGRPGWSAGPSKPPAGSPGRVAATSSPSATTTVTRPNDAIARLDSVRTLTRGLYVPTCRAGQRAIHRRAGAAGHEEGQPTRRRLAFERRRAVRTSRVPSAPPAFAAPSARPRSSSSAESNTWRAALNISPSSSSMWCSMFSFITLALAPQVSSERRGLQLAHEQVDDVVLLEALEDDVLSLWMRLELGIEDLLLDRLVNHHLALDRGEQPLRFLTPRSVVDSSSVRSSLTFLWSSSSILIASIVSVATRRSSYRSLPWMAGL